jgi:uncharacterized Zn finger protein (UPF0148 family)
MIDTNDQVKFCSYCGVFLLSRDGKFCFACGSLINFTKDDELEQNVGIESDFSHDKIAMKKLEIADKIAMKKEEFAVKKVKFAEKMELKKVEFVKKMAKKKEEFNKKKENYIQKIEEIFR